MQVALVTVCLLVCLTGWTDGAEPVSYTPSAWQCSGVTELVEATGSFSSNVGPGTYAVNQSCAWVARGIAAGSVLSFRVTRLDTEFLYDALSVFQGTPTAPTADGFQLELSGSALPAGRGAWSVDGPAVSFVWTSDWEIQATGFAVEYSISNCGGACSQNGVCWQGQCQCDAGWEGADCSRRTCALGCGSGSCDAATNTCTCPIGYYGPRCQTDFCGGAVSTWTADEGVFADHRGPGSYLPNADCAWDIRAASPCDAVRLEFLLFDLELGYDVLRVWNGPPGDGGAQLIAEYSGVEAPPLVSLTGRLWLQLRTDGRLQRSGFTAAFAAVTCPRSCSGHGACVEQDVCHCYPGWRGADCSQAYCENDCSGHGQCVDGSYCDCAAGYGGVDCNMCLGDADSCPPRCRGRQTYTTTTAGTITSGASSYRPGDACEFVISPPPPFDSIVLTFTYFDLSLDRRARVAVVLPSSDGELVIAEYSGTINDQLPPPVVAKNVATVVVRFEVDDGATPHHGFAADWQAISCAGGCSGHGGCTPGGCLCEPGYAGADCSQSECVNNCSARGVCSPTLSACLCEPGWYGVACLTTHCSGLTTRQAAAGTLVDHNRQLTQTYAPYSQCQYRVVAVPGDSAVAVFVTFLQTEDGVDVLTVTDLDGRPLARLSGSLLPYPIVAPTGGFGALFTSDGDNNYQGFELRWTAMANCPGACSGRGVCLPAGVCACYGGYYGAACEAHPLAAHNLASNSSLDDEWVDVYTWNYYAFDVYSRQAGERDDDDATTTTTTTTEILNQDVVYVYVRSRGASYQLPSLFVRYGDFPTTAAYDYREPPGLYSNDHVVRIVRPRAGRWYIGVFGVASMAAAGAERWGYSVRLATSKPPVNGGGGGQTSEEVDGGMAITILIIAVAGLVIVGVLCLCAVFFLVRSRIKAAGQQGQQRAADDPTSFYAATQRAAAPPKQPKRPKQRGYRQQIDDADADMFE